MEEEKFFTIDFGVNDGMCYYFLKNELLGKMKFAKNFCVKNCVKVTLLFDISSFCYSKKEKSIKS